MLYYEKKRGLTLPRELTFLFHSEVQLYLFHAVTARPHGVIHHIHLDLVLSVDADFVVQFDSRIQRLPTPRTRPDLCLPPATALVHVDRLLFCPQFGVGSSAHSMRSEVIERPLRTHRHFHQFFIRVYSAFISAHIEHALFSS